MELIQSGSGLSSDRIVCEIVERSHSGIKRLLAVTALMAVFLGGLFYALRESRSAGPVEEAGGAAVNDLNLSLHSQQLDEIFQLLLVRFTTTDSLTPEDSFLLQSWLQFDERFVDQNRDQSALKYERVSAHLRLGKGLLILDKPIPSMSHFQSGIELLKMLVKENPALVSYRLELADSYQGMGACLDQVGRSREAIRALDSAIRALQDPGLTEDSGQEDRLDKLYKHRDRIRSADRLTH